MSTDTHITTTVADSELETLLTDFLNPAVVLSLEDQLSVVARFLWQLGCPPMPSLTTLHPSSQALLKSIVANQPGKRVLPVPLLSLAARKAAAEMAALAFPIHYQFTENSV